MYKKAAESRPCCPVCKMMFLQSLQFLLFMLDSLENEETCSVVTHFLCLPARCNGHQQPGAVTGLWPRPNGDCIGPGRTAVGGATADLFSEINLMEVQQLQQQLVAVSLR